MSRVMPYECEHGVVLDWGDFGGEDEEGNLLPANRCPRCDEMADAALIETIEGVLVRIGPDLRRLHHSHAWLDANARRLIASSLVAALWRRQP